jgi:release factor glutamine methyltransferase
MLDRRGAGAGVVRLPGIYPPQEDTELIARCMVERDLARGRTVLDVCTGTGAIALAAADQGAASVTAIDVSRRAVLNVRLNALARGVRVEALRGDLFAPVHGRRFDLVVCNPPYVPAATDRLPRHRTGRSWDAGSDGRRLIDRLCAEVEQVLAPGGSFLLTHSAISDADRTLDDLRSRGFAADVVATETIPFGPVMTERTQLLVERGLIEPAQRTEELVVVEAVASSSRTQPTAGDLDLLAG